MHLAVSSLCALLQRPPPSALHNEMLLTAACTVLVHPSSIGPISNGLFPSRLLGNITNAQINNISASDSPRALEHTDEFKFLSINDTKSK